MSRRGEWRSATSHTEALAGSAEPVTHEDPTRTLHHLVARTIALWEYRRYKRSQSRECTETPETLAGKAQQQTDPELRAIYLLMVEAGWISLGWWLCVALIVTGFPMRELVSEQTLVIFISIWAAPMWFCVAGCWNAIWRYYWYVPQAKRRARRDGVGSERFAVSMRRTLPPRRSVISMSVTGLAASVITYLAL